MATLSTRQSVAPSPSGRAAAGHLGQALQPRPLTLSSRALAGHLGVGRRYTDTTSILTPRRLSPPPPPLPDFNRLRADAQRMQQQVAVQDSTRTKPRPAVSSPAVPADAPLSAAEQQAFTRHLQQMRQAVLEDYNRTKQQGGNKPEYQHLLKTQLHFLGTLDHLLHPAASGPDSFMPTSFWKSQNPYNDPKVGWALCCATVKVMMESFYGKGKIPTQWYDVAKEHLSSTEWVHGFRKHDSYLSAPNATRATLGLQKLDTYMASHQPVMVGVSHTLGMLFSRKNKQTGVVEYRQINDGTIDHFVAIVGVGVDNRGRYYRFFDVGTTDIKRGTDPSNRFYLSTKSGFYEGTSKAMPGKTYVLTQLRFF